MGRREGHSALCWPKLTTSRYSPAHEFDKDLDNLAHVSNLDWFFGSPSDREGALDGVVIEETATWSEQSANEENFKELLFIFTIIQLWKGDALSMNARKAW